MCRQWIIGRIESKNNTKSTPEVADLKRVYLSWQKEQKGPHKIMCMGDAVEIQLLYNYLEMYHSESVHIYRSKDTYIEIASKKNQ